MINRLLKAFDFTTRARPYVEFSDTAKIRLNDDNKLDQGITLKQINGLYDTALDITATTWATSPKALKRWVGFDADIVTPDGTSVKFRLKRGGDTLYWSGSAWVAATTDAHWNTQNEVADNIASLLPNSFDLRVVMNLRTTDPTVSPKIRWVKLLVLVDFDSWDDLIYDTIVRAIRNQIRAVTVIQAEIAADTTTLNLATDYAVENSGYNFVGVRAAYNLTDDPNKFSNLALSYTAGAVKADGMTEPGVVTLSSSILAGKVIRLEMEYIPEIAVHTDQDYTLAKVPALVFENISTQRVYGKHDQELNTAEGDFVRNLGAGTAVEVFRPRQSTVRFEFAVHGSPLDMASLIDAIDKWVANTPLLKTWGFDEQINLDSVNELDAGKSENMDDVVMATGAFQLRGVPFYLKESKDVSIVKIVNLNLNT